MQVKFKALTRSALFDRGLAWQSNYFDHRLREYVPMERFARYIYLNPYVNSLLEQEKQWPYWVLNRSYRPEFMELLQGGEALRQEWLVKRGTVQVLLDEDCGV